MHRNEVNVGLVLHERLRSVAVMHIPVDDENPICTVALACVLRGNGHVPEEAETHRSIFQRVVSRRSHGAERSQIDPGHGAIDAVEDRAGAGSRSVP